MINCGFKDLFKFVMRKKMKFLTFKVTTLRNRGHLSAIRPKHRNIWQKIWGFQGMEPKHLNIQPKNPLFATSPSSFCEWRIRPKDRPGQVVICLSAAARWDGLLMVKPMLTGLATDPMAWLPRARVAPPGPSIHSIHSIRRPCGSFVCWTMAAREFMQWKTIWWPRCSSLCSFCSSTSSPLFWANCNCNCKLPLQKSGS